MTPESCPALLIQLLNEETPCAFGEYELCGKPVPAGAYFVTAAAERVQYQAAMEYRNGLAVPFSLTLRIRQHCRTDIPADTLLVRLHAEIIPAISRMDMNIIKQEQGDIHFDKTLARFVLETHITAEGLIIRLPDGEEGESHAG